MMRKMFFTDSVVLEKFVSQDIYSKVTYASPQTIPADIDYIQKNIKDFRGNTILTSAWIALPPETNIGLADRITLPDHTTPFIGSISPIKDYRRGIVHYIEVYVSRQRPGEGSL
jgi:hypothetical protein